MDKDGLKSDIAALLRTVKQDTARQPKPKPGRARFLAAATLALALCALALFLFNRPDPPRARPATLHTFTLQRAAYPPEQPSGRIFNVLPGRGSGRQIAIQGETLNLPLERPYVLLAVDVPELQLCWPKGPWIEPNTAFQTTIFEGGNRPEVTISLYAVGPTIRQMVDTWRQQGRFGGLPAIPDQYRLDSKTIFFKEI